MTRRFCISALLPALLVLAACTTNPVTGKRDYYGIPPRRSQVELDALILEIHEADFQAAARRPPYSVLAHGRLRSLTADDLPTWRHALTEYLDEIGAARRV